MLQRGYKMGELYTTLPDKRAQHVGFHNFAVIVG